jgi:hypothetical protein
MMIINQVIESVLKPIFATTIAALAWFASKIETASVWLDFGVDVLAFATALLTLLWAANRLRIQNKEHKQRTKK